MTLLYEDKDIVVCLKKRGILSQVGSRGEENMVSLLEEYCKCEILPVHRLDKEVGGVMVFAKNKKSAASLSLQVTDRTMVKEYFAAVEGSLPQAEGEMEDLLFFDRGKNKSFVVRRERRGVKKALLSYKTVAQDKGLSLVRVRLHTGRTHQIRVQLASRGFPIIGDRRYGSKRESSFLRLWSCYLSFLHPSTGEKMEFFREDKMPLI